MLDELRLRGLGSIDAAVMQFPPGFTVVTGETGAGKTMLLTGLGLLLGGRADAGVVAIDVDRLEVDGRFLVEPGSQAAVRVLEAGGAVEDGEVLVSRTVGRDGRSRATAGGRSVAVGLLAELGESLVTVHGQADQRGLLRPAVQRAVLDRYAGAELAVVRTEYAALFAELREVDTELARVGADAAAVAVEVDRLRTGVAAVRAVAPREGEDRALELLVARLAHVEGLRRAAVDTLAALTDEADERPAVEPLVAVASRALGSAAGHDPELDALAGRLTDIAYALREVTSDLSSYLSRLDADPQQLDHAAQRLGVLRTLTRAYGDDATGALAWAEAAEHRLAEIDDDVRLPRLAARRDALLNDLAAAATTLSRSRRDAALALADAVAAELQALAMGGASVRIDCRRRPDDSGLHVEGQRVGFGASGIDDVEFLLAAHPGAPHRPLHRGASGGELSRVMLALEVVVAGSDPTPTFVFDEVDAGVGGRSAVEIGRRLAQLAGTAQVLVVTHLAQVAAFADHHLVVSKDVSSTATDRATTAVTAVAGAARLTELSRMLGGVADSELGRGHAAELLDLAAAARGDRAGV
jgi:DNA repair protein RecN (Recombination protein N)